MKKNLSIIIVHWNTHDYLRKLLTFLSFQQNFQIIVVDNASKKPPAEIKKEYPDIQLIQNNFNRGYAFACNQGATKALGPARRSFNEGGEWLLFLNPDIEINPQQITDLVKYAEKNNLDACSVKTNNSYQKPLPFLLSLLIEFTPLVKLVSLGLFSQKTLFGGCLLIKSNVLECLGGWDERFFLWFEDSDLTLRLIKNQYKIGWFNLAIQHSGGASFKKLNKQNQRDIFFHSMDIYAKKHFSLFGRLIISLLKKKYTARKLLPELQNITSITIPNLKKNLLKSFLKKNEKCLTSTPGVEWTVVTSSIKYESVWDWRRQYPEIRFIPFEENKGFASTVNIGFRVATGKWIGTINDDIILTINWLKNLVNCVDKLTGSINPVIEKENGEIESMGIKLLVKGKAEPIIRYLSGNGRAVQVPKSYYEVDATNAAAVIYSKTGLNKVGLLDEKFGSYLEDIDLSLRLTRAGYKNIVSLKSRVKHVGQSSSKDLGIKKQLYDFRNWVYVILKNWSLKELVLNLPGIIIERLRNISGILKSLFKTNSN